MKKYIRILEGSGVAEDRKMGGRKLESYALMKKSGFITLDVITFEITVNALPGFGGAVGCASDWRPGGHEFDPCRGRQHSFVEIDHSTVILPLIQEGQLSVSGERMCTILVNRLED